jgi:Glycosyltransferase family 87
MPRVSRQLLDHPHRVLLVAVAAVLVLEGLRGSQTYETSATWPVLQAAVAFGALALVWRRQELLRLWPVLGLALVFQVGWVVLHLSLHVHADFDSIAVYPQQGNALLHGHYPDSEYPTGAVSLFAFEALVSGGGAEAVRVANAFVMVPFQLMAVAAVWSLRTRWSAWLAALVAVWPLEAFFWEFRYDLAPTAALLVGLALANRGRWVSAGAALGVGAALKWTPAAAAVVLVVWLLSSGRSRDAARHAIGFAGAFLVLTVPYLAVWPTQVLDAYPNQADRGINGESLPYQALRLVGRAHLRPDSAIWSSAVVPGWADPVATAFQAMCLALVLAVAVRVRGRQHAGVAVAALAPVVFLLTNRIFSPQYLVTIVAASAAAAALVLRSRRELLLFAVPLLGATLANQLVYPSTRPTFWWVAAGTLFLLAGVSTVWLVARASQVTGSSLPFSTWKTKPAAVNEAGRSGEA